ncbi:hypothetical protein PI124_g5306 [Phytophthora idaei]|nr:hypothetical protein PI125_g4755 [Phytophthora idaei]KAG3172909.1 hypothetical protein PI126_g1084 [Phytophthora idaei]KAG3250029.1 hypothetical protein PI124_g5306 [Phytophthora idaei]
MIIAAGKDITVPEQPIERDGVSYRLWKQSLWSLAEDLEKKTNDALDLLDGKGRIKTAGSLRKRRRKLRLDHRAAYDALCSAYIQRKANGSITDRYNSSKPPMESQRLEITGYLQVSIR